MHMLHSAIPVSCVIVVSPPRLPVKYKYQHFLYRDTVRINALQLLANFDTWNHSGTKDSNIKQD